MDNQATSWPFYKKEIKKWIISNFNAEDSILDIGAGCGTYWDLLHENFKNIDAVEIYKPNIFDYNLLEKYRAVYNKNIVGLEYGYYDLIIFGDVIEHMTVEDAKNVLSYAYDRCKSLIVSVPSCFPLEAKENPYEKHIQDDLTSDIFRERYPFLRPLIGDIGYMYYTK